MQKTARQLHAVVQAGSGTAGDGRARHRGDGRARLGCGSGQASQFVTRLWDVRQSGAFMLRGDASKS